SSNAQYNLGNLYSSGKGLTKDYPKAFKWYKAAAEQGFAPAQFYLGNMYKYGFGVEQNLNEAKKWHDKAEAQGFSAVVTQSNTLKSMIAFPNPEDLKHSNENDVHNQKYDIQSTILELNIIREGFEGMTKIIQGQGLFPKSFCTQCSGDGYIDALRTIPCTRCGGSGH
ncbi:MAG: hypothetical protein AAFZ15_24975, partial [Bacteroidota bacterium]